VANLKSQKLIVCVPGDISFGIEHLDLALSNQIQQPKAQGPVLVQPKNTKHQEPKTRVGEVFNLDWETVLVFRGLGGRRN
jgi:hypothetical protein